MGGGDEGVEAEEGEFGFREEGGGVVVGVGCEGCVELLEEGSELFFGHGGVGGRGEVGFYKAFPFVLGGRFGVGWVGGELGCEASQHVTHVLIT